MLRPHRLASALALALAFSCLAGCQRVQEEKSYELTPGQVQFFGVDPPSSSQKVQVTISAGAPLDAYLILEDSWDQASQAMQAGKPAEGALDGKTNATEITLSGTAPAGKAYGVAFGNARSQTTARVKIEAK